MKTGVTSRVPGQPQTAECPRGSGGMLVLPDRLGTTEALFEMLLMNADASTG